jgi:hypothetical protein
MLFSFIAGASCFLAGFLWNRLDLSWPMLPVLAAGFYLGLTVAAFLGLVILCAVVDMKKPVMVSGFSYLPRQDGKTHGMTTRYRIELSMDGTNWQRVAEDEFGNLRANPVEQIIFFPAQKARYFRFFSTAALDGVGSSVAELRIIGK